MRKRFEQNGDTETSHDFLMISAADIFLYVTKQTFSREISVISQTTPRTLNPDRKLIHISVFHPELILRDRADRNHGSGRRERPMLCILQDKSSPQCWRVERERGPELTELSPAPCSGKNSIIPRPAVCSHRPLSAQSFSKVHYILWPDSRSVLQAEEKKT